MQLQKQYLRALLNPTSMSSNGTIFDAISQLQSGQEPIPPHLLILVLQCLSTAQDAFTTLGILGHYNGYIPVPSFDAFVAAHKLIKNSIGKLES